MEQYNQPTDLFLEEPVKYAGFWERFGAWLIDNIILGVVGLLIGLVLPATRSSSMAMFRDTDTANFTGIISSNLISIAISWLYFAFQESGPGQATVGKRALGIRVTTLDGGRISFGQATGRYFAQFLSGLILLIGYFMMLWDARNQTLHDKLASTLVVKGKS